MDDLNSGELPPRYHLSGAFGRIPSVVLFLSIASGGLLGLLIGGLSATVDSGRLIIALPFFIGAGIGYGCFWLSQQLHSRNPTYVQAVALLGGMAAAYATIVGFVSSVTHLGTTPYTPPPVQSLLNPVLLLNTFQTVVRTGVIMRGAVPVAASRFEAQCVLQALALLAAPVITARVSMLRQVFCEDCQKWLDLSRKRLLFPVPEREELDRLREGDLTALLEQELHRPIHASKPPYIRLDYVLCNKCGNTGVFRVMSVTPRPTGLFSSWGSNDSWSDMFGDNDGKTIEETALTPLMQLTPSAAHQLGLLQARDRETKAPAVKPAAVKPVKPVVRKPIKPMIKKRGEGKK